MSNSAKWFIARIGVGGAKAAKGTTAEKTVMK